MTNTSVMARPATRAMNPAVTGALLVAGVAAATLAGAWYMQLVWGLQPCELCLKQRWAYYAIVPLGLVILLAARGGAPRPLLLAGLGLIALAALGMPASASIIPASNGASGRDRPNAPGRSAILAAPAASWSGSTA